MAKKAFQITDGKGLHLNFANGYTLSVQFGPGNYCENYDVPYDHRAEASQKGSDTAEIALFARGEWAFLPDHPYEDVVGHCTLEIVAEMIAWIMAQPNLPEKVYTKEMWMDDVKNGDTELGYDDWLISRE